MIIQVFAVVVAFFAISRAFLRLKNRELSAGAFTFWLLIWASVLVVAFVPGITIYFAKIVGVGRGIDIAVYGGIILLFYLVFRIYVKLDKLESDITHLVREIAKKK